jgi:hypothetical protein
MPLNLEWRGKTVQLQVHTTAGNKYNTQDTMISDGTTSSVFGFFRSSLGGGSNGKYNRIETETHYLDVKMSEKSIILNDCSKIRSTELYSKLETKSVFRILSLEEVVDSQTPVVTSEPVKVLKPKSGEIYLFEHKDRTYTTATGIEFKSDGKFELYTWTVSDSYDDGRLCEISKESLPKLFEIFDFEENQKNELLQTIAKNFGGKDAYYDFVKFLEKNKIPHSDRRD